LITVKAINSVLMLRGGLSRQYCAVLLIIHAQSEYLFI